MAEFEPRNIYGTWRYYAMNQKATLLAQLLGKKTLTLKELQVANELGVEVKVLVPRVG